MADSMAPKILVVAPMDGEQSEIVKILQDAGVDAHPVVEPDLIQTIIQETPPACIIVPHELPGFDGSPTLAASMKNDAIYGHLPMIVTLSVEGLDAIDWVSLRVDDFLLVPFQPETLVARVRICLARAQRDLNANPLTGLPGNIAIIREVEARLHSGPPFCVGYLDLDHFKPFNDKYGFIRGDEVLRMTARVVVNAVRGAQRHDTYVGHIGGDDFVFILPSEVAASVCEEIVRSFDLLISNFYDEEDRIRGAIHSIDRQGNSRTFSIMTCSVAVVDTAIHPVKHVADISARAAQVKKLSKSQKGSSICFDRRS